MAIDPLVAVGPDATFGAAHAPDECPQVILYIVQHHHVALDSVRQCVVGPRQIKRFEERQLAGRPNNVPAVITVRIVGISQVVWSSSLLQALRRWKIENLSVTVFAGVSIGVCIGEKREHAVVRQLASSLCQSQIVKLDLPDEAQSAARPFRPIDAGRQIRQPALMDDVPMALSQSLDGVERVRMIVQAMKEFSHVDKSATKTTIDLQATLESTITLATSEWKYLAEISRDYEDGLEVQGFASELNQVFLNLIVNAAHAIQDRDGDDMGTITVRTRRDGKWAVISISDDGCGIPEPVRRKIFDPFFTTKEIGRGTGQGLAISYSIVTERHQGKIAVESTVGVGTTFHIRVPILAGNRNDSECNEFAAVS